MYKESSSSLTDACGARLSLLIDDPFGPENKEVEAEASINGAKPQRNDTKLGWVRLKKKKKQGTWRLIKNDIQSLLSIWTRHTRAVAGLTSAKDKQRGKTERERKAHRGVKKGREINDRDVLHGLKLWKLQGRGVRQELTTGAEPIHHFATKSNQFY